MRALALLAALSVALSTASAQEPVSPDPPAGTRVILRGVHFDFESTEVDPVSAGTLEVVAEELEKRPNVRVRIEGHTDWIGGDAYNMGLSRARAKSVKRILVDLGVAEDRLDAVGFGESRAISDNTTRAGRKMNRRVELVVLEPKADVPVADSL